MQASEPATAAPAAPAAVSSLNADLLELILNFYLADATLIDLCVRVGVWIRTFGMSSPWCHPRVDNSSEWERLAKRVAIFLEEGTTQTATALQEVTTWRKAFFTVSATLARWHEMKRSHQIKWYGWSVEDRAAPTPDDEGAAERKRAWRRRCTYEWLEAPVLCYGAVATQMLPAMPFFFESPLGVRKWILTVHEPNARNRRAEFRAADDDLSVAVHAGTLEAFNNALARGASPTTRSPRTSNPVPDPMQPVVQPWWDDLETPRKSPTLLQVAVAAVATFSGKERFDIISRLAEMPGADVDLRFEGRTALHFACGSMTPQVEVVDTLLAAGADVNAQNSVGQTPLLLLCARSLHSGVLRRLLKAKADVNVCHASDKDTPLHIATRKEKIGAVESLVEYGARVSDVNAKGETAADMARKSAVQWSTDSRCELADRLEELERMELFGA